MLQNGESKGGQCYRWSGTKDARKALRTENFAEQGKSADNGTPPLKSESEIRSYAEPAA